MFIPTAEQAEALRYVKQIMIDQIDGCESDQWEVGFDTGVRDCVSVIDNILRGDFNYDQHRERMKSL